MPTDTETRKPFDPVLFGQAVKEYRAAMPPEQVCRETGLVLVTLKEVEEGKIDDIETFAILCKWMSSSAEAWLNLMDEKCSFCGLTVDRVPPENDTEDDPAGKPTCCDEAQEKWEKEESASFDQSIDAEEEDAEKPKTTLIDGSPVTDDHRDIDPDTGMQKSYVVLSDEERAKGFVRPVRESYVHVGVRPKHPLRDLTDEEKERHPDNGYVKYEEYPESEHPVTGKFWTEAMLNSGCGSVTTMGRALSETYARDPKFYGSTMCRACKAHYPVGAGGEFIWDKTDERVGT